MLKKHPTIESVKSILIQINPSIESWLTDDNVDLFEISALDSLLSVTFIQQLEKEFEFTFDYTDLKVHNFQNLQSIVRLLTGKYGL